MRELAILTFLSLDGVMQAPGSPEEDHSGGFTYGGWAQDCWDDVMAMVMKEAMSDPYDLLLGRKTYEMFAGHFTDAGDDNLVSHRLNNGKKHVVTSTLKSLEWNNSEPLTGNITDEVTRLKKLEGPLLQVHGSWQLIQQLLADNLIDEFRLWIFPVVVGSGKRLFNQSHTLTNLKLIKTESCASGAIMQIYRKAVIQS